MKIRPWMGCGKRGKRAEPAGDSRKICAKTNSSSSARRGAGSSGAAGKMGLRNFQNELMIDRAKAEHLQKKALIQLRY